MGMIPDEEELLDLVDDNEQVVGTITHTEAYNQRNLRGYSLRASNGFILNSKGELWIPKRTAHKKIAPSGLDYSAGEHAQAGEPYIDAIIRGFEEELNITATAEAFTYIGTTKPQPNMPPYFAANYLYFSDEPPSYNPDDFVSYEWLKPQQLLEKLATGVPAKHSLAETMEFVLAYMSQH